MLETSYKILEYKDEELEHFTIKFLENGIVWVYYKGEKIKGIQELKITPQKVELKVSNIEVKND